MQDVLEKALTISRFVDRRHLDKKARDRASAKREGDFEIIGAIQFNLRSSAALKAQGFSNVPTYSVAPVEAKDTATSTKSKGQLANKKPDGDENEEPSMFVEESDPGGISSGGSTIPQSKGFGNQPTDGSKNSPKQPMIKVERKESTLAYLNKLKRSKVLGGMQDAPAHQAVLSTASIEDTESEVSVAANTIVVDDQNQTIAKDTIKYFNSGQVVDKFMVQVRPQSQPLHNQNTWASRLLKLLPAAQQLNHRHHPRSYLQFLRAEWSPQIRQQRIRPPNRQLCLNLGLPSLQYCQSPIHRLWVQRLHQRRHKLLLK
jgi:hypothetical protein